MLLFRLLYPVIAFGFPDLVFFAFPEFPDSAQGVVNPVYDSLVAYYSDG